jgi:hypothetical protein
MFLENSCSKAVTDGSPSCFTEPIPEGGKIVTADVGIIDAAARLFYIGVIAGISKFDLEAAGMLSDYPAAHSAI